MTESNKKNGNGEFTPQKHRNITENFTLRGIEMIGLDSYLIKEIQVIKGDNEKVN